MQRDATEAHRGISVREEMVTVPLMKLKFDLRMVKGQTRPRDEDRVVQRQQRLLANPPNRPLGCFLIWQDEGLSDTGLRRTFGNAQQCVQIGVESLHIACFTSAGSRYVLGGAHVAAALQRL